MADQAGYAVMAGQQPQVVVQDKAGMHWGGGAAWILVWVVVIIIIIALLAFAFMGGDWFGKDGSRSSDDNDRHRRDNCWNFSALGGLVVFIVVILFLCWLLGAAGSARC